MKMKRQAKQISGALGSLFALGIGVNAQAAEAVQSVSPVSASGHDRFYAVAFDQSGNYYAAGSVADTTEGTSDSKALIAKYLPDGTLDVTFGTGGYAIHNLVAAANGEVARAIAVDSTGRVLVGGVFEHAGASDARDRDAFAIRLNADGSLDTTYGVGGLATLDFSTGTLNGTAYVADGFGGFAIDSQDRLVIEGSQKRDGGFDTDFVIARLNVDGALDTTFGTNGTFTLDNKNLSASPKIPVLLPDGSLIGTGYNRDGSVVVPVVFKLTSDGVLDTSYGVNGIFSQAVLGSVTEVYGGILHGGDIVTVGYGKNADAENLDFLSLRIDSTGKLDTTYGSGGYVRIDADGFNDNGRFIAALPDGRVALVGGGRYSSANVDGMIAIIDEKGTPDLAFAENGAQLFDFGGENDFLWGVAVSPSGDKLVAVGIKGTANGNDDAAVVVLPLSKESSR